MVLNYIRLVIRRFTGTPLIPAISALGLSIGFSASLLVAIWTNDELSYDTFHENADRIYRLTVETGNPETGFHWDFARSQYGWLRHLPGKIPGIEKMVRLVRWRQGVIKVDQKSWTEEIFTADASIPDVFTMDFIHGDPGTCLAQPKQVILSKSYARCYFGETDPVDQTIYLYSKYTTEKTPYRVSGVFRDFPPNSHVHPHIISSFDNPDEDLFFAYYYVLLGKAADPDLILSQFPEFAAQYLNGDELGRIKPRLQNIADIHLYSDKDRELEKNGSMTEVKMVTALALFVLFITLFNFFNLRFVFLLKYNRTLRVFRFAGSKTGGIWQFQGIESLIYALLAAVVSLFTVWFGYPHFNRLLLKSSIAGQQQFLPVAVMVLLIICGIALLAGLLPLLFQRGSFSQGTLRAGTSADFSAAKPIRRTSLLKTLVGIQYLATFILIVAVIVVQAQIRLFMNNRLGSQSERIVCLKGVPVQAVKHYALFKEQLLRNPLINDVTASMEDPGYEIRDMMGFQTTGVDPETGRKLLYVSPVDDNFFDFYNIPIIAGNNFPEYSGDDSLAENFILNEKAVKMLGWEPWEAVGKPFRLTHNYTSKKTGRVVGVVKDFQPSAMKEDIRPYVYFQKSFWQYSAQIQYDTNRTAESLAFIEETWDQFYPDHPISYEFVDELYKEIYKGEYQLRSVSALLGILALILSATGLFGITAITYETRTKEIGIRKVNGAGIGTMVGWLLKDLFAIIGGSLLVAIPLSYYLARLWLSNFVHRVTPQPWFFVLAASIILTVALLTVSIQTWKAASRNPVEALRYE